jgi:hypothetical protein
MDGSSFALLQNTAILAHRDAGGGAVHSINSIIYGAITVLSILLAQGSQPVSPLKTAVVLFGSVLAITLAKAFAEFLGNALEVNERMTRHSWRAAWHHSAPTLTVANVPTTLFLAAWLGWIDPQTALVASQVLCVALLALLGARAG